MTGNLPSLCDFRVHRPPYRADNSYSVQWLAAAHARAQAALEGPDFDAETFRRRMERLIARFGPSPDSLSGRGHHLEDYLHTDWERMEIYPLAQSPRGAGMDVRMGRFSAIADHVAGVLYPEGCPPPSDIIHVTCTGYAAPSAVQKLVLRHGWQDNVGVLHAYHMGCYAAMPAVRMASGLLAAEKPGVGSRRVDILHNELCTLHLDPSRHEAEQLVVQSLFADGHIRYSVRQAGETGKALEVVALHEELVPDSLDAMSWVPGAYQMQMTLAREVPEIIAENLRRFLERLCDKAGLNFTHEWPKALFAVHPGGPRIIDLVARMLELDPAQVAASRRVLLHLGNMSSATLPHIWDDMLRDSSVAPGRSIVSLAFGPGLTIYGCLLRKI